MIRASVCVDPALRGPQVLQEEALRLLRHALREGFGIGGKDPTLIRNSFGRPSLAGHPEVHVSLAHCDGAALAAAAGGRIGVDIERVRPLDRFAMARMLSARECGAVARAPDPDLEFFRYWTLKESYVKALGVGLSYGVRGLEVSLVGDGTAHVNRSRASFRLEERFVGYVLAFCCLDGGPDEADVELEQVERTRRWPWGAMSNSTE